MLLLTAQKKERVDCSSDFWSAFQQRSLVVLKNIVTIDKSAVSFYITETKK
jgi:hypothetical protein